MKEIPIEIPANYLYCFNEECPKAKECMRHFATQYVDAAQTKGYAVFPTVLRNRECDYFKQKQSITLAYGFSHLFADVMARHITVIRSKMKNYLGGNGSYYRYFHGERMLSPEQQAWILNLFAQYGYKDGLRFDEYKKMWDW